MDRRLRLVASQGARLTGGGYGVPGGIPGPPSGTPGRPGTMPGRGRPCGPGIPAGPGIGRGCIGCPIAGGGIGERAGAMGTLAVDTGA